MFEGSGMPPAHCFNYPFSSLAPRVDERKGFAWSS
jgi:hypothetical protein